MAKNNNASSYTCATPDCTEEVGERSITGLCTACYSYIYSWGKRTPAQLINRAQKLRMYEARMSFLLPPTVKFLGSSNKPTVQLAVMPGQVHKYRRKQKRQPYKSVSNG